VCRMLQATCERVATRIILVYCPPARSETAFHTALVRAVVRKSLKLALQASSPYRGPGAPDNLYEHIVHGVLAPGPISMLVLATWT